jgi:3-phenylpropionate/trans-cinnamate dioxygenase ferredoxin component
MKLERVCNISDVSEGSMKGFTVKSKYILIAKVEGKFYAVNAVCPHRGGYLPVGVLENNIITCPVHGAQFNVTDGKLYKDVTDEIKKVTGSGAHNLQSYKVSIKDESVFIEYPV